MNCDSHLAASVRLHGYLMRQHWRGDALVGPDPGPRLSYRVGRFIKSYLPMLPWRESHYYLQAQGYWVLGNWRLFALTDDERYRDIAISATQQILRQQRPDGAWNYPHPAWKDRVATFEGIWASLALLATYRETGDTAYVAGACAWHRFQTETIGFQRMGDELSANYFAGENIERTPNTSISTLRLLAELVAATDDRRYLEPAAGMLAFIRGAQRPTGELPYTVAGPGGGRIFPHFQCFQYHGFQGIDLMRYYELTHDATAWPIVAGVVRFLAGAVAPDSHVYYACGNRRRAVVYHAAVVGAALAQATQAGFGDCTAEAERAYSYVLAQQRPDGSLPYSQGDYYLLSDRRSYPRYLAMILLHLLEPLRQPARMLVA